MTEQELEECIAEVKHSDIPESSKKKIMNVLYEQLHKEKWIPCSERMPETDIPVLCQWHKRNRLDTEVFFSILCVDENGIWSGENGTPNGEVVAWMPLPDTYKGEEKKEVGQDGTGK